MTDRELLELAAKAAGLRINFDIAGKCWLPDQSDYPEHRTDWDPLIDDGDALRLAVKLGLRPKVDHRNSVVFCEFTEGGDEVTEGLSNDHYAATRRAIVRAAAEVGRTLP